MRYLPLLILLFVSACSSSSGDGSSGDGTTGDSLSEGFDLSRYIFHSNLDVVGGQISFVENHYEKPSGNGPIYAPTTIFTNTGSGIDQSGTSGAVFYRYTIGANSIVEDGVSFSGSRSFKRFAQLGEDYITGGIEGLAFRETCTLQDQLNEFDLSTATGSVTIASSVYEDVIQVYCDSVFPTPDGGTRPNYNWTKYYARGIGLIFVDGTWPNLELGDIYAIPEY